MQQDNTLAFHPLSDGERAISFCWSPGSFLDYPKPEPIRSEDLTLRERIVEKARSKLDCPYTYGGAGLIHLIVQDSLNGFMLNLAFKSQEQHKSRRKKEITAVAELGNSFSLVMVNAYLILGLIFYQNNYYI